MYIDFYFKSQVIPVEIFKTTKMCKKRKKKSFVMPKPKYRHC